MTETFQSLLGFDSWETSFDTTICLSAVPQLDCKMRSLIVDLTTADAFWLTDVRVGTTIISQLNNKPVPLSMFGTELPHWPKASVITPWDKDRIPVLWSPSTLIGFGSPLQLTLTNRDKAKRTLRFRGAAVVEVEQ